MVWFIAVLLIGHGIAHLPGFLVPWQLMTSAEFPYTTTLLAGRVDVGAAGIRVVGLLWLLTAVLMFSAAAAWLWRLPSAATATLAIVILSLVLCLLGWPYARLGCLVNVGLLLATPLLGGTAWHYTSERIGRALVPVAEGVAGAAAVPTDLPLPVARYFARVLPPGTPPIVEARLEQEAEFFVGGGWKPLRASQTFIGEPPAFMWDARITMTAGLPVLVRDSYIAGVGTMRGEVAGALAIVNQSGDRLLDEGALSRFVAESVWLPTVLLPGEHVRWDPVDERHARLQFTDRGLTVTLRVAFNDAGDIEEIHVADRPREENGRYVRTPWTVRCRDYATFDGIRVPVACAVEWQLPTGPLPYWRGRITRVRYTFRDGAGDRRG